MTSRGAFRAVMRQPGLAEQVIEQLQSLIARGDLRPGDRLPTERELAESFGVSRTVIREAIRSLMARGLVEAPAGRGAIIAVPQPSAVAETMGLLLRLTSGSDSLVKVNEVRRLLEVAIAGRAAERASAEDLAELEGYVAALAQCDAVADCAQADVDFHAALARATGNELLSALMDSLSEIMLEVRHAALARPEARAAALAQHKRILDCLRAGDAASARAAMQAHLDDGARHLARALEAGETP